MFHKNMAQNKLKIRVIIIILLLLIIIILILFLLLLLLLIIIVIIIIYYYNYFACDCIQSQDFPSLLINLPPECDTFEGKLVVASSSDLQELLCGSWILQHYLDRFCPADVAYWLFQILCRHSDQHIISSSFQVLWTLTEAATEVHIKLILPHL